MATIVAAFIVGALLDAPGEPRINILYAPVAPLVLWNLVVYAVLAAHFVLHYGEPGAPGPIARALTWLAGGVRGTPRARDPSALTLFAREWAAAAAPVYAARAARILHVAAAALALGVIAGLYVRGLGLEYRATWESTFLGPQQVRTLAAAFYAAGSWVTGLPVPDVAHVAAIRAPGGENAASWLHLMAATLAVVAIVPRLCLAAGMAAIERYRTTHLLDDLDGVYFRRLVRGYRTGTLHVVVVPYSFAVSAVAVATLRSLLARAVAGDVSATLAPPVAYGDEDGFTLDAPPGTLIVALFNATATPEREAHGRFLATLARAGREVAVVVDESAAGARWGGDGARRDGRRALWRELAAEAGHVAVFVDLAHPDAEATEAAFEAALSGAAS